MSEDEGCWYPFLQVFVDDTPDREGIYMIADGYYKVIYVGRGNIRQSLTNHYHCKDPIDVSIWKHNPTYFYREVCMDSIKRAKELILRFDPMYRTRL